MASHGDNPFTKLLKRTEPRRPAFREEDERDEERARLALEIAFVDGLDDESRDRHLINVSRFMQAEAENVSDVIRRARGVVNASRCECGKCPTCGLREALYSMAPTMRTLIGAGQFRGARRALERGQMGTLTGYVCSGGRRIGSIRMGERVGCGNCLRCRTFIKFMRERDDDSG